MVLGAGGVSGWALHMGAAAELARRGLALDAVERVVGTSAGAAIAAAVLGGVDPVEQVDRVLRPPSDEEQQRYRRELVAANRSRSWAPAAPRLLLAAVRGRVGPGVAWAGLAPAGLFPTRSLTTLDGLDGHDGWPARLWVPAVRLGDGARVVFGRDRTDVTVPDAVAASQAVPLMFRPHEVDGERFVDGAVWSSTHLDLLVDDPPDLAVVLAPMCRPGGGPGRRLARAAWRREVAALRGSGVVVAAARPGPGFDDRYGGFPRRRPELRDELVDLGARLVGDALDGLPG